jgi:hypothetical protein
VKFYVQNAPKSRNFEIFRPSTDAFFFRNLTKTYVFLVEYSCWIKTVNRWLIISGLFILILTIPFVIFEESKKSCFRWALVKEISVCTSLVQVFEKAIQRVRLFTSVNTKHEKLREQKYNFICSRYLIKINFGKIFTALRSIYIYIYIYIYFPMAFYSPLRTYAFLNGLLNPRVLFPVGSGNFSLHRVLNGSGAHSK